MSDAHELAGLRLQLAAVIVNNRIGRGGIVTEDDMDRIMAMIKPWFTPLFIAAEQTGRIRERYEILQLVESLGASPLLTEIVQKIGSRGPLSANLGADYAPGQPGESVEFPAGTTFKTIVVEETWVKRNSGVYHKWRFAGESDWRYDLTPYNELPVIEIKFPSQSNQEQNDGSPKP